MSAMRYSTFLKRTSKLLGVIWDLDGTFTMPHAIDFAAMYRRCGLDRKGGDILKQISDLPEPRRSEAHKIIIEEEVLGTERMQLREGLLNVLTYLSEQRIKTGISTRNCKYAVDKFMETEIMRPFAESRLFHPVLDRDSLGTINKPDPLVAHHIMKMWDIEALASPEDGKNRFMFQSKICGSFGEVVFIGDSVDDMTCGKKAGCTTILLKTDYNRNLLAQGLVDIEVDTLHEVLEILQGWGKGKENE